MDRKRRRSVRVVTPRGSIVERMEPRTLCSSTSLRIVNYNIAADVDGYTTARPGLDTVLEGIGAYAIGGVTRPIDVLALEETTSNATTIAPIVSDLNGYYGAGTYAQSSYQGTQYGSATVGNGPSAMIYNTTTLKLLASAGVGTPQGATNGYYRQVVRYEFEPVGGTTAGDFYVYVMHPKSGGTSTDMTYRNDEAQIVRADEATLPATARVLYVGDFNLGASTEASYQTFAGTGQGQGNDPINMPGDWEKNAAFAGIMSETDTALDYRDDLQMVTSNVMTSSTGLEYTSGTYQAFGNNGSVAVGGSVNSSANTALAGLSNRSAVLSALTTASDHLPIVADYTDPLTTTTTTTGTTLAWDVNGQSAYGTQGLAATTVAAGVTNSTGLTRGSGVTTSGTAAANGWGGTGWASTSAAGITGNQFATFGLTLASGTTESLSTLDLNYRRSSTGPANGYWQYQVGSAAWTLIGDYSNEFSSTSASGAAATEISLSGVAGLQQLAGGSVVNFRVVPYGATSTAGTWYVYSLAGNDLTVGGTTTAAASVTAAAASNATADAAASTPKKSLAAWLGD